MIPAPPPMRQGDWLRLLVLSVLWGATFPLVEVALTGLPALGLVWLRVVIAAAVLAVVLRATRVPFPPRQAVPALLVMGLANNALPFTLIASAQGQIDGALASVLNATTPLFTLVVAALAGQDRLGGLRLAGVVAGVAGVAVMTGGALAAGGGGEVLAMALSLSAAFSYALAGVYGRRFAQMGLAPMATAFGMLAAAVVWLTLPMLVVDQPWALPVPPPAALAAVAVLAVLSTALAYLLFFRLLADVGALNLLLVTFLIPVSAITLGIAFLGEALLPRHIAGLMLVAAALALTTRR